ncbi:hypothetical protein TNCV_4596971 [Trichonephila clavipes]|uniref:Uncharacterized protein n=1 Tax=Trichonephila clavipes TaxID=2585209 RepID=A0A8X6WGK8_TRICX|nr:hypothetical protein TNCV_4596971 [Trichonephila clavipes]
MYASSSSINPTPLAHADNQRDVHPRGEYHNMLHGTWGKGFCNKKKSSNFDHQEEMWCPNDRLEPLKFIQLQNMLNMCFIHINNVLKAHYRVFNVSVKQLTRDFRHIAYNASFQIRQSPGSSTVNAVFWKSPHNQKSQGYKSGEGQASRKCLDITLLSLALNSADMWPNSTIHISI